jgi:hypothetical protein
MSCLLGLLFVVTLCLVFCTTQQFVCDTPPPQKHHHHHHLRTLLHKQEDFNRRAVNNSLSTLVVCMCLPCSPAAADCVPLPFLVYQVLLNVAKEAPGCFLQHLQSLVQQVEQLWAAGQLREGEKVTTDAAICATCACVRPSCCTYLSIHCATTPRAA